MEKTAQKVSRKKWISGCHPRGLGGKKELGVVLKGKFQADRKDTKPLRCPSSEPEKQILIAHACTKVGWTVDWATCFWYLFIYELHILTTSRAQCDWANADPET